MKYVDGMLCAVPTSHEQAYIEHAEEMAAVFQRHGAIAIAECWGDDIPPGETNSLHTAVMRRPDETVVLSWITWPSKAVRDEAWEEIRNDPEMAGREMPFDGQRMIFGGFQLVVER